MPEKPARPSLPSSSTDFALPPSSSSSSNPGSPVTTADDTNPLLVRFRRPSILAPKAAYFSETRLQSPLVASFTLPSRRKNGYADESESDRMWTDSSPSSSSENPTPPLGPPIEVETAADKEREVKVRRRRTPLTPPRNTSPSGSHRVTRSHARRPSGPVKQPRILNLLHEESRPEESEVKSEAAFQRLIASGVDLPMQPRTPRAASDRGRYPEEAGHDETQREDTPSDDDAHEESAFAFMPSNDAIKPHTPAGSVSGSVNGDEMNTLMMESPGMTFMDVDMPLASPSLSNAPASQWRYTPPPTTSAIRSNKRKLDDRFDPYPSSSKRRAVSPSVSYFRDMNSFSHPRTPGPGTPRLSIPISIPVPASSTSCINSAASSPTVTSSYPTSSMPIQRHGSIGHMSVSSSPTMRSSMSLASPVIRPVPRARREGEEREVEGAGEAVNGLTLG